MRCVPNHFKDVSDYEDVFLPIFLEESMAQIHRSKYAERGPTEKVHHQKFVNVGENEEYIRLTVLRTQNSDQVSYNRGDIILISQEEDPLEDCRAHAICYVDSLRNEELSVILRIDLNGTSDNKGFSARSMRIASCISSSSDWWLTKICSISTASREYVALTKLRNVDPKLLEFILNKSTGEVKEETPIPSAGSFRVGEELWKCIEANYNQFQVEAIRHARKRTGVSLCLGPPGTGKTTTILGMLSVLLGHTDDEEDEVVCMRGKKKVCYSRSYGGQNEAERVRRILAGEPVSDNEDEDATMSTDEDEQVQKVRESDMMNYSKIGRYEDWMDSIPEQPLDNTSLLTPLEYSLREKSSVRVIQMGSAAEAAAASADGSKDKNKNRILVCAPSNAAIDEILRRIVGEGLWGKDGEKFIPTVVRVGPNVHPSLAQYSLERMAQAVQVGTWTSSGSSGIPVENNGHQDNKAKVSVLKDAQIVCSTLSVAGSMDLKLVKNAKFETVVIDEASQCIELSTLIPLQMGCRRLVLVGDHKQLPATVFSRVAERHLYNRSLFERLHQSGYPMCVLKLQMRMHPAIAQFPSDLFYGGEIENAPNILDLVTAQPWYEVPVFGPLVFYDIEEGRESVSLQSKVNEEEAAFVELLITTLMKRYPLDASNRIVKRLAVVSPYSEQVRLISDRLRKLFGVTDLTSPCPIEVNTIDGFQGREKDIIIASTVRASEGSIGFLADIRRMNVMLTRARTNMWIVGHGATLAKDPSSPWAQLVHHIDHQKRVVKVTHPIQSFFGRVLPAMATEEVADLEIS